MIRRRWCAVALGVVVAGAGAGVAMPASATIGHGSAVPDAAVSGSDVLVSVDGVNFSTGLDEALFDGSRLLIPGESVSASLWITNPTSDPALLRVSAKDVEIPVGWAQNATITVHDTGTSQTLAEPVGAITRCDIVVPAQTIAAEETIRTDIRFTFGDLTGTSGQNQQMGMDLTVAMQDDARAFPPSACEDSGVTVGVSGPPTDPATPSPGIRPAGPDAERPAVAGGEIARTGGEIAVEPAALAALAIGAGLFLLTSRRRDHAETGDRAGHASHSRGVRR